jgi:hypothetical protein
MSWGVSKSAMRADDLTLCDLSERRLKQFRYPTTVCVQTFRRRMLRAMAFGTFRVPNAKALWQRENRWCGSESPEAERKRHSHEKADRSDDTGGDQEL